MGLLPRLQAREREGRPVRVAVVGVGQMGAGVARQVAALAGMRLVALCDVRVERALGAAEAAGLRAAVAADGAEAARLVREGRVAVTARAEGVADLPVDVLVDATGEPEVGARLGLCALRPGRALVSLNVEADVTVGPLLGHLARRSGAVYTLAAGDEPAALGELVDEARLMGLEVICAGKGKNNRLDRTATPARLAGEARTRGMSPRMLTAFVDGTKTMAELAALANAAGLGIDRPGLHGPAADLADLLHTFVPEGDGGILQRRGVVDYAVGDVAPGVFLVVTAPEALRGDLAYLRMGDGPYYLLHRPYHLASLEVPRSIARAALDGEVTLAPAGPPRVECVAVAKRDLRPEEVLDGIGGETVYGLAEEADRASAEGLLPVGLAQGARVLRPVAAGCPLRYADVVLDEGAVVVQARRLQDALLRQGLLGGPGG
ncbi:MAG: SAF domain-containing protein [Armatimonadota bacterium]|nr:SAF domain-containing protein [Armatimonadota bacterium]MDR7449031.1 SAF domain-containing protein [Armatimonadota bacterium]MDR7459461.1 SAF domain-containing protein [Armatimonadota bacterium]MDR7480174.1 SAF domain-containing protein [Armatimonadota bacterium]MDR7488550.1 SAF domain-containing protein [Armatimonadota bacterium]